MEHLNRIELRGVVGNVTTQILSGSLMSRFSLATSRAYKDKGGVAVIETTWHNVIAWENDKIADLSRLDKGAKVYVSGRIHTQKYTGKDEIERTSYEVVATRLAILDTQETLQYEF